MGPKRFQTLLIDLDGTLLSSSPLRLKLAFILLFLKESKKQKIGFFHAFKTLHRIRIAVENPDLLRLSNKHLAIEIFSKSTGLSLVESEKKLISLISTCFYQLEAYFQPIPAAIDFIQWSKQQGYHLILATNPFWPEEIVRWRLSLAQIPWQDFSYHTTSDKMKTCKPMVGYYQELIQQQNLHAGQCLMIGNDLRKDSPASQIGIEVFLVGPQKKKNPPQKVHFGEFSDIKDFLSESFR